MKLESNRLVDSERGVKSDTETLIRVYKLSPLAVLITEIVH